MVLNSLGDGTVLYFACECHEGRDIVCFVHSGIIMPRRVPAHTRCAVSNCCMNGFALLPIVAETSVENVCGF